MSADADVVRSRAEAQAAGRAPLVVLEPLAAFLDAHGIGSGPAAATPIGEGHSNVTYAIERAGAHVVVRRPPRPPLPPSAHDVVREARLQQALAAAGVRVPRILAVCEDPAPIGAPFYVMEHLDGHVVTRALPPALDADAERARCGHELVDALVELHAVEPRAAGLERFGRPDGYLARQLRRFGEIWAATRTRELPAVERVGAWLADHLPATRETTVVHGDYRLGNVMLERDAPLRVRAILDWELATLGDPLADVGYLLATWASPDDPEETPMHALSAVTRQPGFARADELRERYAARSGRTLAALRWYEALALWKAAIFLEASYRRFRDGTTDDAYFATLGVGVPALARAAARRAAGLA